NKAWAHPARKYDHTTTAGDSRAPIEIEKRQNQAEHKNQRRRAKKTTRPHPLIQPSDRRANQVAQQTQQQATDSLPTACPKKNHPEGWFFCSMKTSLSDAFH